MSDNGAIKAAANKQRRTEERLSAVTSRKWHHIRETELKEAHLRELEAIAVSNRTAIALGDVPVVSMPDASEMETLRTDVAICGPVVADFENRRITLEDQLKTDKRIYNEAVAAFLEENAVRPALRDWHQALEAVRAAAVRLMAAHHLTYRKFASNPLPANNALELYGPISELIFTFQQLNWPEHPYAVRPDWLPPTGGFFWPDEMVGVAEHNDALMEQIAELSA